MRQLSIPFLALGLVAVTLAGCGSESAVPAPDPIEAAVDRAVVDPGAPADEWVAGINQAGWDFHRTLDGNAVSSPVSLGAAFSLLRAGASEPTDATLDNIFGFPLGDGAHTGANSVLSNLASATDGSTTLDINNQLFVRSDPLQPFVDTAASHYGAALVPMSEDNAQAASEINSWTNDKTRGLVPKIVEESTLTDSTKLVIVNTVYLDAKWQYPFEASYTRPSTFHLDESSEVQTDFMFTEEPLFLRYVELSDSVAVELPYQDGDLAMWLIVPTEINGLEAVESELDAAAIADFDDAAFEGMVMLSMPKWEFALPPTDLLETWLCPAGLCTGAPLAEITPALQLQFALHGAKIIVDEEGTEAGAATAIGGDESGPPPPDVIIDADHPFTYVITHEPTGAIVFVGRVTDPTKS